jgi:hypothetical protein
VKQMESEIERVNLEISNMREAAKIRAAKSAKTLEASDKSMPHLSSQSKCSI